MQIQNPISGKYFLPLSLGYLWSYCQTVAEIKDRYDLKGVFMFRDRIDDYLSELNEPDVIGISTYVWNWEVSKKFAVSVKEKWPKCKVIMGGPHVPYKIDFIRSASYVDYVVSYEGEEQFAEFLLENLKAVPDFKSITGMIGKETESIKKRKPQSKIDVIPSPYLNGFFDKIIKKEPDRQFNIVIETNRGCPYSCSFCDMQDSFYTKLRQFGLHRVLSEIEWASDRKIEHIECADSNFGIFSRDLEIIRHLCQLKSQNGYPRSFNFTSAKNQPENVEEIQKELVRHGLKRGISVSLQSFNEATLQAISRWNSNRYDLESKLHTYKQKGYESYIELILGLPEESKTSWMEGIGYLLDSGYDGSLLIHPLSIVPNTPFSDPQYIKKFGLSYTATRSPAQGFCYGTESPEERELICYQSNTMSSDDWVDAYFYGKSLVGSFYYHGLLYYLVEYLRREVGLAPSRFFSQLLDYCKRSQGFLGQEYKESTTLLRESLFELRPWGRKIFGDQDMYWSDQAATAMKALAHYQDFSRDVESFVVEYFYAGDRNQLRDLMTFNHAMLEWPTEQKYSEHDFAYNWHEYFTQNHQIVSSQHRYIFQRKGYVDYKDHALDIFWFGRKSRRCFVKGVERCQPIETHLI